MAETIYFILTEFLWMSLIELNSTSSDFFRPLLIQALKWVREHCASSAPHLWNCRVFFFLHHYTIIYLLLLPWVASHTAKVKTHSTIHMWSACQCVFSLVFCHNDYAGTTQNENVRARERNRNKFPFLKILIHYAMVCGSEFSYASGIVTGEVKRIRGTRAFALKSHNRNITWFN